MPEGFLWTKQESKEGEADSFELSLPFMLRYNWQIGNGYV